MWRPSVNDEYTFFLTFDGKVLDFGGKGITKDSTDAYFLMPPTSEKTAWGFVNGTVLHDASGDNYPRVYQYEYEEVQIEVTQSGQSMPMDMTPNFDGQNY